MTNPTLSERFTACFDHNILTAADRLYVLKTEILQALDDNERLKSELAKVVGNYEKSYNEALALKWTISSKDDALNVAAGLADTALIKRAELLTESEQLRDDSERYRATIVQLQKERAEAVERVRVLEKRINDVDAEMKASERYRGERGSF